ncbi:ParB/RepB/Spo0J family partition protein [Selenomonas ruminantium]|uniref:ParB-like nuclease domain-containing protein n=1 Tax=Selenomonas ruminantium TaxID=971 RepID=A0A1H0P487_SELRU|nr:ParB N-terminal domain-containing protein [Selenomonas ruminantium]SDO99832.1 ParB-like nuclease domain-containing protein [Selenomonas ruminantium]
MAGFNLMGLMNQASKTADGAPKYELRKLNINELYPDPENQKVYSVENIEELADAIEIAGGVLHNLVVRAADETGKYMIISGERRWTACKLLVNEKRMQQFAEVNCLIENEHDEDMLDLLLMLTNSTARQLSDAEKMRQAERMTDILNRMKEQNGLEGRVRDIVGKMLQMSSGKLARYHAIAKNLQNEDLKQAFQDGRLKVTVAYEASQLSEEGQQKVADQLNAEGGISLNHVTIVKHEEREDEPGWAERMEKIEAHRQQDALNKIWQKAEKYGYDALTPCENCHLATACMKCCESCREVNEECGVAQGCHRKLAANYGKWELVETEENGDETYKTGRGGYKSYLNFVVTATVSKDMAGRYCGTYCVEQQGRERKWEYLSGTYDTKDDVLRAAAMEVAKTGTSKAIPLKDNGYIDEIPVAAVAADEEMRERQREEAARQKEADQAENDLQLEAAEEMRSMYEAWLEKLETMEGPKRAILQARTKREIKRLSDEITWRKSRTFN